MKAFLPALFVLLAAGWVPGCAGDKAKVAALKGEIATIEAKLSAASPELEAEQHGWEAQMLQAAAPGELPAGIRAILALEPSEREPRQREELVAYFRPLSKTATSLNRQLAAKRAELAAIEPVKVQPGQ